MYKELEERMKKLLKEQVEQEAKVKDVKQYVESLNESLEDGDNFTVGEIIDTIEEINENVKTIEEELMSNITYTRENIVKLVTENNDIIANFINDVTQSLGRQIEMLTELQGIQIEVRELELFR